MLKVFGDVVMFNLNSQLIALRRSSPVLQAGAYRSLDAPANLFIYERFTSDERFLILLNFSGQSKKWVLPDEGHTFEVTLSTQLDQPQLGEANQIMVRGHEGLILRS